MGDEGNPCTIRSPGAGGSALRCIFAALLAAAVFYCLSGAGAARRTPKVRARGRRRRSASGDSYISGEAGRWAGNTNESSSKIDALGSNAYDDNSSGTGELIEGCHRSKSAEVYIGSGVNGENLACSGAKTSSFTTEGAVQAGHRLLQLGRQRRPGADAPALRRHPQREAGGAVDRRQQLQLRRDRDRPASRTCCESTWFW